MDSNLLWQAAGLFATVLIAVFGAVSAGNNRLMGQFQKQMDLRFEAAEKSRSNASKHWEDKFLAMENAVKLSNDHFSQMQLELYQLKAELPDRYLRREDFILHQTRIEAKLDGLALKIENTQLRGDKHA